MATYTTPAGASPYIGVGEGGHRGLVLGEMAVELPSTVTTGDIVWLGWVPKGAVLVDYFVRTDDIDTGSSVAFVIGDGTTTNRFVTVGESTTAARAGGVIQEAGLAGRAALRFTKFADATRLRLTVVTGAETPAAGSVFLNLTYFIDPEANLTTAPGVKAV